MISVEKACEIATKERKEPFVESIIDVGYGFVIGTADENGIIKECFPTLVHKEDGNVEPFRVPEYMDDLKNGKKVRIPIKYRIPKVGLIVENFEDVKKFFDYLIIDDDGWKGIRDDAPDDVKKAFEEWQNEQKDFESQHLKI